MIRRSCGEFTAYWPAKLTVFRYPLSHSDEPYEEAINVPLLVRYSKRIDGGQVSDAVVSLNDFMPTLLSLCDAEIPGEKVQGVGLSDHILGDNSGSDRAYVEGWRVENDDPEREDWGRGASPGR